MAKPKIYLGDSFLDRLIKDTYGKTSLGELSTEQMNELEAYMKSDDFKTKSAAFRSSDRNKFEGSVDHFFGKDTNKSKTYLQSKTNPDTTKYLIPRLMQSTPPQSVEPTQSQVTASTTIPTETATAPIVQSTTVPTVVQIKETPKTFAFDQFVQDNSLNDIKLVNGKKYVRYDPTGIGDFYVGFDGKIYEAKIGGGLGSEITSTPTKGPTQIKDQYNKLLQLLGKYKIGGKMNRINYFQKGGTAQQGAQDIQQQVVALVQAAIQGDEKANQTVNQIMDAAKKGDQQAMQLAQMIQAVLQQMKGQVTSAKWGSKLNYIRSLKYAKGGKTCSECEKGAPVKVEEKACGGKTKKAKKHYLGGWL